MFFLARNSVGFNFRRKFRKLRFAIPVETVKNIGEKIWGPVAPERRVRWLHVFRFWDHPAKEDRQTRRGWLQDSRPEWALISLSAACDIGSSALYAGKSQHRFTDDPDAHSAQRTASARRNDARGIRLVQNA